MTNQRPLKTNWSNKSFATQIRQKRHVVNVQKKLSTLH